MPAASSTRRAKKTRKKPIASLVSSASAPSISRVAAQARISEFHRSLKRKSTQFRPVNSSTNEQTTIDSEALDEYQKLSQAGQEKQRGGDSSKVLVPWLKEFPGWVKTSQTKMRMLEIGAVRHDNYASQESWLINTPIDLHSQHPDILEQNFFDRPIPLSPDEGYDVISCSLVLNFVGNPIQRGEMLRLAHDHLKPKATSMFFLVLPLPCVENSRYLDRSTLIQLMGDIGFELLRERYKGTGKVGYWLWVWRKSRSYGNRWSKKVVVNSGDRRNNFSVLLPAESTF